MSQSFIYPACADESTGPCQLQSSSSDACSAQFGDSSFYQVYYCMCTNGYYDRSSECWNDCYHYSMTTTDTSYQASLSRESRIVSLDCESYSLAGESESAFYASLSAESVSLESADATYQATRSDAGGLTPGATPQSVAPETTTWVERPSGTASATRQGSSGGMRVRAGGVGVLGAVTIVLALMGIFS